LREKEHDFLDLNNLLENSERTAGAVVRLAHVIQMLASFPEEKCKTARGHTFERDSIGIVARNIRDNRACKAHEN